MKVTKSTIIVDYKLVASFENVKQKLLRPKFADRLDKPLAYWVVATDRRLPLAFMSTPLGDLLNTPLEQLYATPGIGQKKIRTLITLLARASQPRPPGAVALLAEEEPDPAPQPVVHNGKRKSTEIDPTIVSEALWVEWRASVRDHGLGQETLGRYVSSLQQLPRVIWSAPLDAYLELSLSDIRALKTHGEKRVAAVLEVFGNLHQMVVRLGQHSQLGVRILPKVIVQLEGWMLRYLQRSGAPNVEELRACFVKPLIDQVRIDAGPQIARLTESRLGPSGATVRQAAQRMGLTRARIYQLLSEVATIMRVRWPEGHALTAKLQDQLQARQADGVTLELLNAANELFFMAGESELPPPFQLADLSAAEPPSRLLPQSGASNGHAAGAQKSKRRSAAPKNADR